MRRAAVPVRGAALAGPSAALRGAVLALAGALAGPAAAKIAAAPEGCEAFLTVQLRGCVVQHHRRCVGEPAGHRWMTDVGADGSTRHQLFDADAAFVAMRFPDREGTWALRRTDDPMSVRGLLETGRDELDYLVAWTLDPGKTLHTRGWVELTGRMVAIDGERLHEARSEMEIRDEAGGTVEDRTGRFLISPRWSYVFPADFEDRVAGWAYDNTPVEFIEPGEPGFLAPGPIHDCGIPMSAVTRPGGIAPA